MPNTVDHLPPNLAQEVEEVARVCGLIVRYRRHPDYPTLLAAQQGLVNLMTSLTGLYATEAFLHTFLSESGNKVHIRVRIEELTTMGDCVESGRGSLQQPVVKEALYLLLSSYRMGVEKMIGLLGKPPSRR